MEELKKSLNEYIGQLSMITAAIQSTENGEEKESLVTLQSELQELIHLTQENLDAISEKETSNECAVAKENIDDEYARFMQEMAKSGAYEDTDKNPEVPGSSKDSSQEDDGSDIEEDLSSLLGMKCAVYHTHKWGGVPSLHNAMVSTIVPRQDDDQFKDLQVQILFTHPTHAEMLPCPFYLNGECRFTDEQCRYSHGDVTLLSDLKDAMEPNFELVKVGSRILIKLKPPDDEVISLKKKSAEKYHLWHRAIVKTVDFDNRSCVVKLESGVKSGEKRKIGSDEVHCTFEEIYPLNAEVDTDTSSDDSVSDTEYPESKTVRPVSDDSGALLAESLPHAGPAMGEWERHTRGIGSKLMLAMGYVPGRGLGAAGEGRVLPVEARVLPVGKSLDHCMAITEANGQDPLKVEQRLRRLQKKEEERNKRAYEREQERERRNVFNFLNKTLGDKTDNPESSNVGTSKHIKQSTNKDLNIEKFKIAEDTRKVEREITKLNSSLARSSPGSELHRNINIQIGEKNKELNQLRSKEQQITKEQSQRKNKQNMVF